MQTPRCRSWCVEGGPCDFRECRGVQNQQTDSILVIFYPEEQAQHDAVVLVLVGRIKYERYLQNVSFFGVTKKFYEILYYRNNAIVTFPSGSATKIGSPMKMFSSRHDLTVFWKVSTLMICEQNSC